MEGSSISQEDITEREAGSQVRKHSNLGFLTDDFHGVFAAGRRRRMGEMSSLSRPGPAMAGPSAGKRRARDANHQQAGAESSHWVDATDARPSQLRALFLRYDRDNSGGIDADELGQIFADVQQPTSKRELLELTRAYGKRRESGMFAIDFEDFCRLMVSLQRQQRLGGLFDFDACGGMTSVLAQVRLDEAERGRSSCARCRRALKRPIASSPGRRAHRVRTV